MEGTKEYKVLVTGGLGFIGSNFIRRAIKLNYKVINLDKITYAANKENLSDIDDKDNYLFYEGDICDEFLVDTISKIIIEPFIIHKMYSTHERNEIAIDLLEKVGLNKTYTNRYPHELSGGERQRVSIARALALKPSILVADEPTSALDVCVKAQVINLLQDLQDEMGLSILFISHELNVLRSLADKITVMYRGRVVEEAPTEQIFANPIHPYTKSLLEAIPKLDPSLRKRRTFIDDSFIQSNIPKYSLNDVNFVSTNDSQIGFVEIDNNHFVEAEVV